METLDQIIVALLIEEGLLLEYAQCVINEAQLWTKSKVIPDLVQDAIKYKCLAIVGVQ